jgi:4-amino-4-deoxy-L-arabinose transferase-like glycosyltransferase
MDSVLAALKDTPIPTLLVIAGIVFLLLSIAGQLAGRIAVPPERQRWAAVIGGILLISGVALYVVPPARLIPPRPPDVLPPTPPNPASKEDQPPPTSTTLPSPRPPSSTPVPTPQPSKVEEIHIPSLNARITALQFFEGSPCNEPVLKQRAYRQRFAKVITRDIFTELTLEYPKHEQQTSPKFPLRIWLAKPTLCGYTRPLSGKSATNVPFRCVRLAPHQNS